MRLYLILLIAQIGGIWRLKKDFSEYDLEFKDNIVEDIEDIVEDVEDTGLNKYLDAPESRNVPENSDKTYVEDTVSNKTLDAPETTYVEDPVSNTTLDAPDMNYSAPETSQNVTFRLHYFFIKYFFFYVLIKRVVFLNS